MSSGVDKKEDEDDGDEHEGSEEADPTDCVELPLYIPKSLLQIYPRHIFCKAIHTIF